MKTVRPVQGQVQETPEQELVRLRAENAALKAKAESRNVISVRANLLGEVDKHGEPCKGNVSLYGLGRFPVTLYASQWERLLTDEVRLLVLGCIEKNKAKLSSKD